MKRLPITILAFVGVIVLFFILIFILPFDKRFGREYVKEDCYNHALWIYDRMHSDPQPIDIAFLGSSRTIHAVNDKLLELLLDSELKAPLHVANLGYCRFGRNMEYENLLELVESKKPSKIIVEVGEEEDRFSHIDYGYIADFSQVSKFVLYNPDYFGDIWKAYTTRLQYWKTKLHIATIDTIPIQGGDYGYGDNATVMDSNYALEHIHQNREESAGDKMLHSFNYNFAKYYLNQVKQLADNNHIQIYFLYLAGYTSKVPTPREKEFYESLGKLLLPPADIFTARKNFTDENHLNNQGSRLLCAWLSHQLASAETTR